MGEQFRSFKQAFSMLLVFLVQASSPSAIFYGGQAVIEGVLMKGENRVAVSARRKDGTIVTQETKLDSRIYRSKFWALPVFRGMAVLYEMLALGMRAMQWSANVQLERNTKISPKVMKVTVAISAVFGLGIFVLLPAIAGLTNSQKGVNRILVEGLARATFLVLYIGVIGFFPKVKRVFQYHGAEHKAINCLESGEELEVSNVAMASRLHPRCGTGFILVVAMIAIIVFIPLYALPVFIRLVLQVALAPVVAGISYEGIRGLTKIRRTKIGKILLIPVLNLQKLSTREPDTSQMEVAITSLKAVLEEGQMAPSIE